jgi:hypothetical protein
MNKIGFIGIIIVVLVIGGILWIARPDSQDGNVAGTGAESSGIFTVDETFFDFGTISMAAGKVSHVFKVKNTGTEPVVIGKMYTSCMCTTATLVKDGKEFGPYGMQGHGFIPKINELVRPDEEVKIEVVFDPAAHGPAGIGRIQREVTVENNADTPLELRFNAFVTP